MHFARVPNRHVLGDKVEVQRLERRGHLKSFPATRCARVVEHHELGQLEESNQGHLMHPSYGVLARHHRRALFEDGHPCRLWPAAKCFGALDALAVETAKKATGEEELLHNLSRGGLAIVSFVRLEKVDGKTYSDSVQ